MRRRVEAGNKIWARWFGFSCRVCGGILAFGVPSRGWGWRHRCERKVCLHIDQRRGCVGPERSRGWRQTMAAARLAGVNIPLCIPRAPLNSPLYTVYLYVMWVSEWVNALAASFSSQLKVGGHFCVCSSSTNFAPLVAIATNRAIIFLRERKMCVAWSFLE